LIAGLAAETGFSFFFWFGGDVFLALFGLAASNPEVLPLDRRAPLGKKLRNARMYPNLELAVEVYQQCFHQEASKDCSRYWTNLN
jgi:hypothetical protein